MLLMHLVFRDHYIFKEIDIRTIEKLFHTFGGDSIIVTTEKDAVRLMTLDQKLTERLKKLPLFYQPVEVEFEEKEKFNLLLKNYVETASTNYRAHQD